MGVPDDPLTLALGFGTLLVVAVLFCLPALIRVLRIRRAQRALRWAYWPFIHEVDMRDDEAKW